MNKPDDDKTETPAENNVLINEVKVEKKKSNTDNDADFGFLMSIFDFLTW